jgi:hypothetical protein
MAFNAAETLSLIKGGLLDRRATWASWLGRSPTLQRTAIALTVPLLVISSIASWLFGLVVGNAFGGGLTGLLYGLVMALVGIGLATLAFGFFAGMFGGKQDYPRAFAAVSLAMIPAALAGPVSALIPWFGLLVLLAGGIASLVFLYQVMPLALQIPDDKRVVHFLAGIVTVFLVNAVLAAAFNPDMPGGSIEVPGSRPGSAQSTSSGMIGELERQGALMEEAANQSYDPPADGKLTRAQVEAYATVRQKTRAVHEAYAEKMQELKSEIDEDDPSAADIAKMYSGIGGAMSANNAEMEIVMTGGGNWPEHQWVASALRTAMLHGGKGTDAVAHNYALYQEFEKRLE